MGVVAAGGTAAGAAIQGVSIAGKTGTAQMPGFKTDKNGKSLYYAWFAGMAPADAPQDRRRRDGAERDVRGRDVGDLRHEDHRALSAQADQQHDREHRLMPPARRINVDLPLLLTAIALTIVRAGDRLLGGSDRRAHAGDRRVQAAGHLDRRRHRRRVRGEPRVGATDRVDDGSRVRAHDRAAGRAAAGLGIGRRHRDEHRRVGSRSPDTGLVSRRSSRSSPSC